MKKNRLRLISVIEFLFSTQYISDEDIKSLDIYESFIDQKSVDALRMFIIRDINELKKLRIIKDSKTQNGYYELTQYFENIKKEYDKKIASLYKSDISDEELEIEYINTEEMAKTIFDTFSIPLERRVAIRKSMELESFLEGFTLAFTVDNILKVKQNNIQQLAIDIILQDYLLPENHLLPWNDEDKKNVISLISRGKCIDLIAKKLKRTRTAILRQLPEFQIIKNLISEVNTETIDDPEAIYRLTKVGILNQNSNTMSDNLKSILEWNKSVNINTDELTETILYDYYFLNCIEKEFIPLSELHFEMQKVNLLQNYYLNEDDIEEIDTEENDEIYRNTTNNQKNNYRDTWNDFNREILEKRNEINNENEIDF